MFAIIKTGGKQYKVEEGTVLKVDKLAQEVGTTVEFPVLMLNGKVGTPLVEGASVVAEIKSHDKAKKIISFKYNRKTYYKKQGHRQPYTLVEIKSIKG